MMFDQNFARRWPSVMVLAFLLVAFAQPIAEGQEKANFDNPIRASRVSSQLYMSHIEYLASDELGGRATGSPGLELAADYVANQFKAIGLEPIGEGGYFQNFEFTRRRRQAVEGQEQPPGPIIKNVVGVLKGAGPNKDEWIVIGGHYDHLNPRGQGEDRICNGADDNASGTAGVIEVARMLKSGKPLNRSVLFIGFTAEESGLVGSSYYGNNPLIPMEQTVAMVNMDMIGRLHLNKLQIHNSYSGKEYAGLFEKLNEFYHFDILPGSTGASDHAPFLRNKIPSMFLFTGLHSQYHQIGDHIDLINVGGAVNIVQMAGDIIYAISSWKEGPTFQEGNGGISGGLYRQPNNDQLSTRSDGLRIPSGVGMQVTVKGSLSSRSGRGRRGGGNTATAPPAAAVTVESVVEGSPAEAAGLKAGDGLVRIGEGQIGNINSLTAILAGYNQGDKATIVITRDGAEKSLEITFGR